MAVPAGSIIMWTSALSVGSGGSWEKKISMSELLKTHCRLSNARPGSKIRSVGGISVYK
jgi:hypothetical protein